MAIDFDALRKQLESLSQTTEESPPDDLLEMFQTFFTEGDGQYEASAMAYSTLLSVNLQFMIRLTTLCIQALTAGARDEWEKNPPIAQVLFQFLGTLNTMRATMQSMDNTTWHSATWGIKQSVLATMDQREVLGVINRAKTDIRKAILAEAQKELENGAKTIEDG